VRPERREELEPELVPPCSLAPRVCCCCAEKKQVCCHSDTHLCPMTGKRENGSFAFLDIFAFVACSFVLRTTRVVCILFSRARATSILSPLASTNLRRSVMPILLCFAVSLALSHCAACAGVHQRCCGGRQSRRQACRVRARGAGREADLHPGGQGVQLQCAHVLAVMPMLPADGRSHCANPGALPIQCLLLLQGCCADRASNRCLELLTRWAPTKLALRLLMFAMRQRPCSLPTLWRV
jgi:hypothetical protein